MKMIKKIFTTIMVLCVVMAMFALTACNNNPDNTPDNGKTTYTVTFNVNGGSAVAEQKVEEGGLVTKPADPTKEGSVFSGWCKDEGLETPFDFENETVSAAITIYASWADAADTSTAKFHINYEGAVNELFATKVFGNNSRIPSPGSPERSGYYFAGWYTQDGTVTFSDMKKYTGNQDFYAKWQKIYIFEAEKTQLTGLTDDYELGLATEAGAKLGHNFSGDAHGAMLIKSDAAASSGKYISGLYYRSAYLQFEIESDKAVEDATLRLVLSCEYADISLTSTTYRVSVNGTNLKFSDIKLGNGASVSTDPGPRGGFKEIYIANISLKQGANVIRLTVNNQQTPAGEAGTVDAASPCVDCIKIYTDATLTMTEYDN